MTPAYYQLMPARTPSKVFPEHLAYRLYGFLVLTLEDAGFTVLESRIGDQNFFIVRKGDVARAVVLTLSHTAEEAHRDEPLPVAELEYLAVPPIRVGGYANDKTNSVTLVVPEELELQEGSPTGPDFMRRLEQWLRRKYQGDVTQLNVETRKAIQP